MTTPLPQNLVKSPVSGFIDHLQKKQESTSLFSPVKFIFATGVISSGLYWAYSYLSATSSPSSMILKFLGGAALGGGIVVYCFKGFKGREAQPLERLEQPVLQPAISHKENKLNELFEIDGKIGKKYYVFNQMVDEVRSQYLINNSTVDKALLKELKEFILLWNDCTGHANALENYFSILKMIDPEEALNIAFQCYKELQRNSYPKLNDQYSKIIEMIQKDKIMGPKLAELTNHCSKPLTLPERDIEQDPVEKKHLKIIETFRDLLNKRIYWTDEKPLYIIQELYAPEGIFDYLSTFADKKAPKKLIEALTHLIKKLLVYRSEHKAYKCISEMTKKTYEILLKIDKDSALAIACACVKKQNVDPGAETYREIVDNAIKREDLAIPFALLCAEKAGLSDEHQIIAEKIWNRYADSPKEKIDYLIGCTQRNNDFCQDKLVELVHYDLNLVKACADHLFPQNSCFPRRGNKFVIFQALKNLHSKSEEEKQPLLPIAKQIVETYRKAKQIEPCYFEDDLIESIDQSALESEFLPSSEDAAELVQILAIAL
jgi:hypothetical protein